MLRYLRQLFGREETAPPRRPGEERRSTPRTSAASVLAGEHPAAPEPAVRVAAAAQPPADRQSPPELSLEEPDSNALGADGDGQNPYNTGSFKRPDAWQRVKKADQR